MNQLSNYTQLRLWNYIKDFALASAEILSWSSFSKSSSKVKPIFLSQRIFKLMELMYIQFQFL